MESKIQLWGVTIQIPHTPVPEVSLTILLNNPKATSRHRTEPHEHQGPVRGQAEATHTLLTNKGEPRAVGSLTRGESAPENGCWVVAPAPQAWAGPAGTSRLMRSETFVFAQIRHQAGRGEETYQNIKAMWMFLRTERWARGPLA